MSTRTDAGKRLIAALPAMLPWQQKVLAIRAANPDAFVMLGGGRYSGKSFTATLLILDAIFRQGGGKYFRGIIFRSELKGSEKLADTLDELLRKIFGVKGVKFNKTERRWTFAGTGSLSIEQLGDSRAQDKIQGGDITLALADDCGLIDPKLVRRISTSLRSNVPGIHPVLIVTANPGDRFSGVWANLVREAPSGGPMPFASADWAGQKWVVALSNIFDNVALDAEKRDSYIQLLKADCWGNPTKERQQIYGDWQSASGGFFESLDMSSVRLPDGHYSAGEFAAWGTQLREIMHPDRLWVSGDWGASAPSSFALYIQTPADLVVDGTRIGAGSLIAIDEWHSARRSMSGDIDPDRGILTPTPLAAHHIRNMVARWGVDLEQIPIKQRILDAACFAAHGSIAGSLGDELRAAGAAFTPGPKGSRADGWMLLSRLWHYANSPAPSVYVTARCEYFFATVYSVMVNRNNPDDLEGADHFLDQLRAVAQLNFGARHNRSHRAGFALY